MLTIEYISRFASCFTAEKLRARAERWPYPLTWTWFLGERLLEYNRKEVLEIASVAIAHASKTKIPMKERAGVIWQRWLASPLDAPFLASLAQFGVFLDAHAHAATEAEKAAEIERLEQATTQVIEPTTRLEPEPPPEPEPEPEPEPGSAAALGREPPPETAPVNNVNT